MTDVNFEVKQEALTTIQNTVIEANFDECKAALTEMMKPYQSMLVTEDGIAAAKNDRARIRKVASGIEEMRKTVKKAYNAPLADFEAKCKELVGICDEGSGNLDGQIKAFEEREADEKIARLKKVYDESEGIMEKDMCPWEAVYNPKWRNKGYSEDDAKGEIANALLKTREDIETIRTLDETDRPYLLDFYKSCRDIGQVIRKSNELKLRRMEEQRRAAEAAERQRQENERAAKETIIAARSPDAETKEGKPNEHAAVAPDKPDNRRRVVMCVWGTDADLMELSKFMKAHNIEFGPVE